MLTYKEQKKEQKPQESKTDHTGIPAGIKTQFQAFSGLSFDDVRIHYGSDKPAQMQAYAFTQGNDVYIGPGQEKHLPHELGHVIQQKRQRLPATCFFAGRPVNTDIRMERLADSLAWNALRRPAQQGAEEELLTLRGGSAAGQPIQRLRIVCVNQRMPEEPRPGMSGAEEPRPGMSGAEEPRPRMPEPEEPRPEEPRPEVPEEIQDVPAGRIYASVQEMLSVFQEGAEAASWQWDQLSDSAQEELRSYVPQRATINNPEKTYEFLIQDEGRTLTVTIEPEEWYVFTQGGVKPPDKIFKWEEIDCGALANEIEKRAESIWENPVLCLRVTVKKPQKDPWNKMLDDLLNKLEKKAGAAGPGKEVQMIGLGRAAQKQNPGEAPQVQEPDIEAGEWCRLTPLEGMLALAVNRRTDQFIHVVPAKMYAKPQAHRWIEMPSIASGDQFSVLAAMLAEPTLCLLIVSNGTDGRWSQLFDFLKRKLGMGDCERKANVLASAEKQETGQLIKVVRGGYKRTGEERGAGKVGESTKIVAAKYNRELRKQFRNAGRLDETDGAYDERLKDWLDRRWPGLCQNITNDNDFIVLWFRFSGRKGEAHPEHDTSFGAMERLIGALQGSGRNPVILLAGDDYGNKAQAIAGRFDKVYNMTEFWVSESMTHMSGGSGAGAPGEGAVSLSEWGGDDRIGQARVYDYIARKARSVRHIGSRSGNLELMSLIGHKVLYFEEANSIGGSRMEEFQRHDEGLPEASPDRLNYERVIIDRPLTFKGRFERGAMDYVAGLINSKEPAVVTEAVRRLLPDAEEGEDIGALKERLMRWRNRMLEIMQGRTKGKPEFWETDDSSNEPQAVRGLLERIAGYKFEEKESYETADSPRASGIEFELRKYLEQMFMIAAVFRKGQLVRERLQEEQPQEEQPQGGMLLPRVSQFLKDESWYADFIDKIMRALRDGQGERR